jgi:hypothetical protein
MSVHLKWAVKALDLKEIVKGVGPGFGTVVGIVGLTIEIMTAPSSWRPSALLVLFTALFLVAGVATGRQFIASGRRRKRLDIALAQIEDVSKALEEDTKYVVVPAKAQDITWTVQLRADCYSEEDALPEDLLQEWYSTNPNGFFIIKENNGPRIGHLDLLPIRPRTLKKFCHGKITERQILEDSLYSPEEKESITDLYIEGIIISPPEHYPQTANAVAMRTVLQSFGIIIETLCNPKNLRYMYAVAASQSGERTLKHLGFQLLQKGEDRVDSHDLYEAEYATVAQNVAKICDKRSD